MSLMICPPCEFSIPLPCKEFTTDLESPSKTELLKLVYNVKLIACLVASNSKISIDDGFLIFLKRAAMTSPLKFQITTPILASCDSPNIVPSKLVFKFSEVGGLHLFTTTWHIIVGGAYNGIQKVGHRISIHLSHIVFTFLIK